MGVSYIIIIIGYDNFNRTDDGGGIAVARGVSMLCNNPAGVKIIDARMSGSGPGAVFEFPAPSLKPSIRASRCLISAGTTRATLAGACSAMRFRAPSRCF